MKKIAIIPARGGSKRIPKKNIKEFCGKPIISYSIEAALKSKIFDIVMVSTDSNEIADIAKKYGAEVPFLRSSKNSDDYALDSDVIKEVLECYELKNLFFDYFCYIYPTAPFITSQRLIEAFEMLVKSNNDSIVPVVRYSFPPQRAFIIKNGLIEYQYPMNANKRSQDLETIFHECGQFYICRTEKFLKTMPYVMSNLEVQDIDTIEDWTIAEEKFNYLKKKHSKGVKNV